MQKLAILSLAVLAVWVASFGLPDRTAIAWQTAESAEAQPAVTPEASPDQPAAEEPVVEEPVVEEPIDPEVEAEAVALLQQARDRLYEYRSVDAKLVHRAAFGNRRFAAEGRYRAGSFPQLRVEYRIRIGESEGVVLEVCDGQILRTSKHIQPVGAAPEDVDPSQYQVSRKNVRQILQASDVEGTTPDAVLQAELGIGGLPALLASIERTMEFEAVREQTWQEESFVVLQGRWRREFLEELDSDPNLAVTAQQAAPFMPQRVRVYLHRDTLFPTRILYLRQATTDPVTFRAIMSIEFSDVKLNQGVDPTTFRFVPREGVREYDETNQYIRMIEQYRESKAAAVDSEEAEAADTEAAGAASPESAADN